MILAQPITDKQMYCIVALLCLLFSEARCVRNEPEYR